MAGADTHKFGCPIQAQLKWETGNQLSEFTPGSGGSMVLAHTNVWANGVLIATDDVNKTHFYLNDWLGTRRVQTDYAGTLEQSCASLPYGDGETCGPAPTENLYTGKERDAESGNDYFGARYYASTMGRFLSPDWASDAQDVPYADYSDPQSLNLYDYMRNDPLGGVDADGHKDPLVAGPIVVTPEGMSALRSFLSNPIVQLGMALIPGGAEEDALIDTTVIATTEIAPTEMIAPVEESAAGAEATQTSTQPYDTGTAKDLRANSQVGDNLDVHHVPQSQPASQTVQGYDKDTAPAMALPKGEHQAIPTEKGEAVRSPRDQLAKDVRDLRNHTNAPNSQIQKVIEQNKTQYPEMNKH